VVAAAIESRLRESGDDCVYLDARHVPDLSRRFPTVTAACLAAGIDPSLQPIPVVPGAHYSCGGIETDIDGRTDLAGLFAAGEVARTGMHGANRLASNSLLEGLVVGDRAGRAAVEHSVAAGAVTAKGKVQQRYSLTRIDLHEAMTRWASLNRDAAGLHALENVLAGAPGRPVNDRAAFEDAALTVTARAVAVAALARTESRGCHHRSDFPEPDPAQAVSRSVRVDIRVGAVGLPHIVEPTVVVN